LLFNDPKSNTLTGITFRRTHSTADAPAGMCDWCHSVRGGDSVGLMTVQVDKSKTIGLMLCRDLSCREKVTGKPDRNDIRESLSVDQKQRRILERMSEFARKNLF
jgi:hypothetical protein